MKMNKKIMILSIMAACVMAFAAVAAVALVAGPADADPVPETVANSSKWTESTQGPLDFAAAMSYDGKTFDSVTLGNNILVSYDPEEKTYTITGTLKEQDLEANDGFHAIWPSNTEYKYGLAFAVKLGATDQLKVGNSDWYTPGKTLESALLYIKEKGVKEVQIKSGEVITKYKLDFTAVKFAESVTTPYVALDGANAFAHITQNATFTGTDGGDGLWQATTYTVDTQGTTYVDLTLTGYNGREYFDKYHIFNIVISGNNSITIDNVTGKVDGHGLYAIYSTHAGNPESEDQKMRFTSTSDASLTISVTGHADAGAIYMDGSMVIGNSDAENGKITMKLTGQSRALQFGYAELTIQNADISVEGEQLAIATSAQNGTGVMTVNNSVVKATMNKAIASDPRTKERFAIKVDRLVVDSSSTIETMGLWIRNTSGHEAAFSNAGKVTVSGNYAQAVLPEENPAKGIAGLCYQGTPVISVYNYVPSDKTSYIVLSQNANTYGNVIIIESTGAQHVTTEATLVAAVANGGTVKLDADITLTSELPITKPVTIQSADSQNKNTIHGNMLFVLGEGKLTTGIVTVKNVNIDLIAGVDSTGHNYIRDNGAGTTANAVTAVFDGCAFTSPYENNSYGHIEFTYSAGINLEVKNCSFTATANAYKWAVVNHGINAVGTLTITDCTFSGFTRAIGTAGVNHLTLTGNTFNNIPTDKETTKAMAQVAAWTASAVAGTMNDVQITITGNTYTDLPETKPILRFHSTESNAEVFNVTKFDVQAGLIDTDDDENGINVINFNIGSQVIIPSESVFEIIGHSTVTVSSTTTMVNNGIIRNTGDVSNNGTLTNAGNIGFFAGTVTNAGVINNTGEIAFVIGMATADPGIKGMVTSGADGMVTWYATSEATEPSFYIASGASGSFKMTKISTGLKTEFTAGSNIVTTVGNNVGDEWTISKGVVVSVPKDITLNGAVTNNGWIDIEGTLNGVVTMTITDKIVNNGTIEIGTYGVLDSSGCTGAVGEKGITGTSGILLVRDGGEFKMANGMIGTIPTGLFQGTMSIFYGGILAGVTDDNGFITLTDEKKSCIQVISKSTATARNVEYSIAGTAIIDDEDGFFVAGDKLVVMKGATLTVVEMRVNSAVNLSVEGTIEGALTGGSIYVDGAGAIVIESTGKVDVDLIDFQTATPNTKVITIKQGGKLTALLDGSDEKKVSIVDVEGIVAGAGGITVTKGSVYINGALATADATGTITVPAAAPGSVVYVSGTVEEGVKLVVSAGTSVIVPKETTLTFEIDSELSYEAGATVGFEDATSAIIYEKGSVVNDVVIEVETKEDTNGTVTAVRIYLVSENEKKLIISVDYVEVLPGKTYGDVLNGVIVTPTKKTVTFDGWYNLAFNEKIRSTDIVGNYDVVLTACYSEEGRVIPVIPDDDDSGSSVVPADNSNINEFALPIAFILLVCSIFALGFVIIRKK